MQTDITRTRIEVKYLVSPRLAQEISDRIPAIDRQEYRVTTIYFDSPEGSLGRMALTSPYRCVKVRAREYLNGSSHVWFEIKSRTGAWTRKWRFRLEKPEVSALLAHGLELSFSSLRAGPGAADTEMDEARHCLEQATRGRLVPLGAVYAHRRTFDLEQVPLRFTLDQDISYHKPPAGLYAGHPSFVPEVLGEALHREPQTILELKHAGETPYWCNRIVAPLTVSAYSKFRTLLQCVDAGRVAPAASRWPASPPQSQRTSSASAEGEAA